MNHFEENGHVGVSRGRNTDNIGDSLAARLKSLRIEALARKKELEAQKAAIEKELAEIDETFGFTVEEATAKPKPARKPRAASVEVPDGLEAKIVEVIADYRTKGVSLATLAELVDAPKEAVAKAVGAAVRVGFVVKKGRAKGTTYHPAE